jgi:hypothetical protein
MPSPFGILRSGSLKKKSVNEVKKIAKTRSKILIGVNFITKEIKIKTIEIAIIQTTVETPYFAINLTFPI